jgi:hypothetical protein
MAKKIQTFIQYRSKELKKRDGEKRMKFLSFFIILFLSSLLLYCKLCKTHNAILVLWIL